MPHGSVVIRREGGPGAYRASYDVTALENVAQKTRTLGPEHLAGDHDVTPAFVDYVRPLVGELPELGRLSDFPAPR